MESQSEIMIDGKRCHPLPNGTKVLPTDYVWAYGRGYNKFYLATKHPSPEGVIDEVVSYDSDYNRGIRACREVEYEEPKREEFNPLEALYD